MHAEVDTTAGSAPLRTGGSSTGQEIADRIEQIAGPVVASLGFELVEVVCHGGRQPSLVRLVIDGPKGIRHGDCESVSRVVGTQLDVEELFQQVYTLEVTSPGLDRRLKRREEYEKYQGRRVKIKEAGQVWVGRLEGLVGEEVRIRLDSGEHRAFRLSEVQTTQLIVEIGKRQ